MCVLYMLKNNPINNYNISKYIKEQTNKWLEKYSNSRPKLVTLDEFNKLNDKTKKGLPNGSHDEYYRMLPFVSIFSFILGYNCNNMITYVNT